MVLDMLILCKIIWEDYCFWTVVLPTESWFVFNTILWQHASLFWTVLSPAHTCSVSTQILKEHHRSMADVRLIADRFIFCHIFRLPFCTWANLSWCWSLSLFHTQPWSPRKNEISADRPRGRWAYWYIDFQIEHSMLARWIWPSQFSF